MQQNATIGNLCLSIPRFPGLRYAPALRACLRHPFQSGVGSFSSHNKYLCPERSYNNPPRKFKIPKKNNSTHISTIKKSAQTYVYIRDSFTTFAYILSISCSKTWFFSKKQEILPSKSLFAKMLQLIRMENSNSLSLYAVLSFNKKF